jgi:SAM-dependent methyltransferase
VVVVNLIDLLRKSSVVGKLIPTLDIELDHNLRDCSTVLDLGCGPNSPVGALKYLTTRVGVEPFGPYVELARSRGTHDQFHQKLITELDFEPASFDAVIMIDVIEHMTEEDGLNALQLAEKWARKKVIINSPNGFIAQKSLDGNPLQEHKSGWSYSRMKELGYHSRGLAGPKWLRQEVEAETMGNDLMTSIRFRPRFFWFVIATLLQPIVYRIPQFAFSLMSVKSLSGTDNS